jgi:hypothetical protein
VPCIISNHARDSSFPLPLTLCTSKSVQSTSEGYHHYSVACPDRRQQREITCSFVGNVERKEKRVRFTFKAPVRGLVRKVEFAEVVAYNEWL